MRESEEKNPLLLTGMHRQNWAVEELKKKGGKIYYPELSNFRPKAVGHRLIVHSHVWIGDDIELPDDMKIQAFCFVPNGVVFEEGVFLGPRVTFTNDRVPPDNVFEKTHIERNVAIGAGAVIRCGVLLAEGCLIGCGSVVTRDVRANEVWAGNPAKFLRLKANPDQQLLAFRRG